MPADEVRAALIVATNEYHDTGLGALRSPAHDAQELARVLGDESIGNFNVNTLVNQPQYLVMEQLETFFSDRRRDDLLLLYFSCHGVKDDDGRLHFAATNTRRNRLASTAVPADWVTQQMDRSRSNRVVLMLDCCYSGAFGRGVKGDSAVGVKERFDGRGRVILTASNAIEYSFEGDEVSGIGQPSVFTAALVQGLASGEADRGGDGLIDVDELYDYVYGKVRENTPNQTPGKWALGVEGELYVARSLAPLRPRPLPTELRQAVESPLSSVREGAVKTLSQLLTGSHGGLRLSARAMLQHLANEDDSRAVSHAATAALAVEKLHAPTDGDGSVISSLPTGHQTVAQASEVPQGDVTRPLIRQPSDAGPTPTDSWPRSGRTAAKQVPGIQEEPGRRPPHSAKRKVARQALPGQRAPEQTDSPVEAGFAPPSERPSRGGLPDGPSSPPKPRRVTGRRIAVALLAVLLLIGLAYRMRVAAGAASAASTTALVIIIIAIVVRRRRSRTRSIPSGTPRPANPPGQPDSQTPTFRVVALGVAGSGKTVFLASMFHDLSLPGSGRSYFLETDIRQRVALSSTFTQLASVTEAWPRGTQLGETREFTFDFATFHDGAKHQLMRISYLDYAGELLEAEQEAGSTSIATLEDRINKAHSLLGIIDGQRVLQYLRGEPEGREYLQHTIRPMIGVMASASCPIQFIITKWDIVCDFGERACADDNERLKIVRRTLITNTQIGQLVAGRSHGDRAVRIIPVSAVGPGFARIDSASRVVKSGSTELAPSNLEIPLSAVLPDFFGQVRSELDAHARQQIDEQSHAVSHLSAEDRLAAMTKFAGLPAGMAVRSNLARAFGANQADNAVGTFFAWLSKPSDAALSDGLREGDAAGAEHSVVEQLRASIVHELNSTLSQFETHFPASVLTGG